MAAKEEGCHYDVFLSFRGEDTRKTFTDHLYNALIQHGFRIFRDDDEMEKGERLKSELEKAIIQSKASIIVLSKNYASSTWCLDELVLILERKRNSKHVVLPVFYDVDPSHIRKQKGSTGEAFAEYEEQVEAEMNHQLKMKLVEKIRKWRSALTQVAELIGLDLQNQVNGHEAAFIIKIVQEITQKLRLKTLDVAPYKIAMESRAKDINMWLQEESTDVSIRAICGMGGIGKSTIAKYVYNQNCTAFEASSFLANISEVSDQNNLVCLQRQLLSDICRMKYGKINNIDEGVAHIRKVLCGKRVLLVLDDVVQMDQIYFILGMQDWLFPGSKVIITTRHERLLKPHQIFRIEKLDEEESIKLISLHAFGNDTPVESYREHTERAAKVCEGLPFALKVVGSSLCGKNEDEWVCQLAKLEAIPPNEIFKKLKTSFDSLNDDSDKKLFLDIACFFVGTNREFGIKILEKCDLHAKIGIQNLIDRCLLDVDNGDVLRMHILIQEMGRQIIQQESQEPGERSRLWHHRDAFGVLKDETGTRTVEGLALDMSMVEEARENTKNCRDTEFYDNSFKNRFLSFITGQSRYKTITNQNDISLRTNAFESMTKLRLLKLKNVELRGSYERFPKSIVWLSWHGFRLKVIPMEFELEKVVVLDLHHSKLQVVWNKTPFLESLKILDLSYSECLERTPNFIGLPNLESLILKGCVRLVEVCESIGNLEMLESLDLSDCITLKKLPINIGLLSLKNLDISGCNISGFSSETFEVARSGQAIVSSMVATLKSGPDNLLASLPRSLQRLNLSRCNLSDESFPDNLDNLPFLRSLNLSENIFRKLPNWIKRLTGLDDLLVNNCNCLQSIDLTHLVLDRLCFLNARYCTSLENVKTLDGSVLVDIIGCSKLLQKADDLKNEEEDIGGMQIITSLGSMEEDIFSVKVTFEFGITSMYLSRETTLLFADNMNESTSISFVVPELSTHKIQYLNVCCTFRGGDQDNSAIITYLHFNASNRDCIYVKIENKTKELTWIYSPATFVNYAKIDCGWASRWRFGNQLEAGDEITISFCIKGEYKIKECGYRIGYGNDEEKQEKDNVGDDKILNNSHYCFPGVRLRTGEYFMCQRYNEFPNENYWFPHLQCFVNTREEIGKEVAVRDTSENDGAHGVPPEGEVEAIAERRRRGKPSSQVEYKGQGVGQQGANQGQPHQMSGYEDLIGRLDMMDLNNRNYLTHILDKINRVSLDMYDFTVQGRAYMSQYGPATHPFTWVPPSFANPAPPPPTWQYYQHPQPGYIPNSDHVFEPNFQQHYTPNMDVGCSSATLGVPAPPPRDHDSDDEEDVEDDGSSVP